MGTVLHIVTLIALANSPVQDKDKERSINFSGDAYVDWVYRDSTLNEASAWIRRGELDPTSGTALALSRTAESNDIFSGKLSLRWQVNFAGATHFFGELQNKNMRFTTGSFPSQQNVNIGQDNLELFIEQAYIKFRDFPFAQNSTLTFGAQHYVINLTGRQQETWERSNNMFVDASEAENPYDDARLMWPLTRRQTMEPAGFVWNYHREALDFTFALLPTVFEQNQAVNNDHALYAAVLNQKFSTNFTAGLAATVFDGPSKGTQIITIGAGANWTISRGLDIWTEAYKQSGKIFDSLTITLPTGGTTLSKVKANGVALNVGGRLTVLDNPNKPWIEISALSVGGAKKQSTITGEINETKTDKFVSYENNDDFIILESNEYGLDVDTNYTALKLKFGSIFSIPGEIKDNFPVSLKGGFFSFNNSVRVIDPVSGVEKKSKDLGVEVDLDVIFKINKLVSLNFTAAILSAADAMELYTKDGDSGTFLLKLGTSLSF